MFWFRRLKHYQRFDYESLFFYITAINFTTYHKNQELIVDKSYLSDQKIDCGILVLTLLAFDERINDKLVDFIKEGKAWNSSSDDGFHFHH
jgi:hypothetical protein